MIEDGADGVGLGDDGDDLAFAAAAAGQNVKVRASKVAQQILALRDSAGGGESSAMSSADGGAGSGWLQFGPRSTAGDVLVLSVNGDGDETATFNASAAQIVAGGTTPIGLADGQTLTLRFEGGVEQTVVFATADFVDISNATPEEVAAVINAAISGGKAFVAGSVLTLASDTEGTNSSVEVTGGTANAALGFPAGPASGTGPLATSPR
jgi:hypothetical protein